MFFLLCIIFYAKVQKKTEFNFIFMKKQKFLFL